ncbi:MAG: tail protein X [Pseudobdellovibrionaceae bacterium]|nr:tail protein X [Pseudobdellovibrionaceae bacterium]
MSRIYELRDGDELDLICFEHYGFSRGSVEAVLKANPDKLGLFDDLGRVQTLEKPESILLPDVPEPVRIDTPRRLFN